MRKFLGAMLERMAAWLNKRSPQQEVLENEEACYQAPHLEEFPVVFNDSPLPKVTEQQGNSIQKKKTAVINYSEKPLRDVIDLMEFPFVALSKDRTNPLVYESEDKTKKVVISGHRGHFLASIYDWDIILVVAGKIQEILNNTEIPPQTISIPRHELLRALHKQDGKKQQKDLEKSLDRLKLTGISTTVNNKDYRHRAGFGFIDRWGYTERKNDRETRNIKITLSPWLYELCCAQGSLLKSNISYFDITSGLKKFLYRTARKHAGNNRDGWEFTVENLYTKSGSEGSFKLFKSKLKKVVFKNDLPDYSMEWVEKDRKLFVVFKKSKIHEIDRQVEEFEKKQENINLFNGLKEICE